MKRILVTSTELMMLQFLAPHIQNLIEHDYEVEIACSEVGKRFGEVQEIFKDQIPVYRLELYRSPLKVRNFKGLAELSKILREGNYDLVWTNEPVMGVMTRLAARKYRKSGMHVMYIAHGFHFYKGASLLNWILFYPIEYLFSFVTDVLVTINREDFCLAKNHFHAGKNEYIHGIGLDTHKFSEAVVDVNAKRAELGVPKDAVMLLSMGELGKRKNHEVIIRAIAQSKCRPICYVICGKGKQEQKLKNLAEHLGVRKQVTFLGYRLDTAEICKCADIFLHPSKREGLGIAALEGMSAGLPLIASRISGILDYTSDGKIGYTCRCDDTEGFQKAIDLLVGSEKKRKTMGAYAQGRARKFDFKISSKEVLKIIDRNCGG